MINNITQLKIYKLLFKGTCNISWLLFLTPVKGNSFNPEMRMKSYTKKHWWEVITELRCSYLLLGLSDLHLQGSWVT